MKASQKVVIFALVGIMLTLVASSSYASAQDTSGLAATIRFAQEPLPAGATVTYRIVFDNNNTQSLQLNLVGLHFDWMPTDGVSGHNYTSSPIIIPSGGSDTTDPLTIQVPSNVQSGNHTFYIAVDGLIGTGGDTPFIFTSPTYSIQVIGGSATSPTPTTSPGGGNNQPTTEIPSYLINAIIIVVVAVVAIVLVIFFMRRRGKQQPSGQPPAEKPSSTPSSDNQNYDI